MTLSACPTPSRVQLGSVLLPLLLLAGCSTQPLKEKEMTRVAKDWSMVMRASQVIPVYPLTEDLQPGDVLLVSTPIDDQAAEYKKRGFLPLDQLLVRLNPATYPAFYGSRYGIDPAKLPPGVWQAGVGTQTEWGKAPRAVFPSYKFSVKSGKGLSLALPIQGIPFALGLMQSGNASGSVTISDAYTYGLDNVSLIEAVQAWAGQQRPLLRSFAPLEKEVQFLRVVSRVYLAGEVNISLLNDESAGVNANAGAEQAVPLAEVKNQATAENYTAMLGSLNKVAALATPVGGSLKVASASSRSVSLQQKFPKPLVIGYLGFDFPILDGGRLGAPVSTLARLNRRPVVTSTQSAGGLYKTAALAHVHQALLEAAATSPEATAVLADLDKLAAALPEKYPFATYVPGAAAEAPPVLHIARGATVGRADYQAVQAFLGNAQTTIETLQARLRRQPDTTLAADLAAAVQARQDLYDALGRRPEFARAIDYLFLSSR